MSESAVLCMSLYYEDVVSEWTEKNNNLYGTVRTIPRCKFDSCPFTTDAGVWCPLKDYHSSTPKVIK